MSNTILYKALANLVGAHETDELTSMKIAILTMQIPVEERDNLIFAIDALLNFNKHKLELTPEQQSAFADAAKNGELVKEIPGLGVAFINRGETGDYSDVPDCPLCGGSGLLSPNDDYSKKIHHIIYGLKSQIGNAKLRNDSYDTGYLTAILKEVEELLPPQLQCNVCLGVDFEDCEACEGTGLSFEMPEYYAAPQPQGDQS